MKTITLLLMMAGVGVAQAQVYKCPGKVEGQYTYQAVPCKGAKADEHTLKIIPADEQKIAEAQAELAKKINAQNIQPTVEPPTETKTESNSPRPSPEKSQPPAENANSGTVNNSKPAEPPRPATGMRPAPVVPGSTAKQPAAQPQSAY